MRMGLLSPPGKSTFQPRDPLIELVRQSQIDPANRRSQEALAEAIAPGILATARRFCRLEHDADEVAQDALVQVLQHLGELREANSFRSWMYRIVYRASLRSNSGPGADSMMLTLEQAPPLAAKQLEPGAAAADREQLDLLRGAVNELQREAAGVLHLLFAENLSLQEVAEVLGRPRTTIADIRDKAFATLRAKLQRRGVGVNEGALSGLLAVALPIGLPAAAVRRVVNAAFAHIDGLASAPVRPGIENPLLNRMSLSKAFLLSCMTSLVIASIFLMMQFPRRSSETATESTLRVLLNGIHTYRTMYGRFPIDRELVQSQADSLEDPGMEDMLNANLVRNLLHDQSQGPLAAIGEGRFRELADGARVVIDEWGVPYVIKPLVEKHGNRWQVTGIVAYSRGRDGEHNWARLAYLARAGTDCWPPSRGLMRQWPADDTNLDNVYLDPDELESAGQ